MCGVDAQGITRGFQRGEEESAEDAADKKMT